MGNGTLTAQARSRLIGLGLYQARRSLQSVLQGYDVLVIDEASYYYSRGGGNKAAGLYQWELQQLCKVLLEFNPALHTLVRLGCYVWRCWRFWCMLLQPACSLPPPGAHHVLTVCNALLLLQGCFEPSEGSLKLQRRCGDGALVGRMKEKGR